jgi:hypothetical protein
MAAKAHISGYQDDICTWSESGLHAWQIQVCEVPLATNNTKKKDRVAAALPVRIVVSLTRRVGFASVAAMPAMRPLP